MATLDPTSARFEPHRPRLVGLAYRMLGSYAEAEDAVQDAFLRFRTVAPEHVSDPGRYLLTTVARLCLDRLKSARVRRESYVGTWLPEPVLNASTPGPEHGLELAEDLSFALLMLLERLSPQERTAFLLHDVFGMPFAEIAPLLERTEASCRKLAERARGQVHAGRTRYTVKPEQESRLFQAFMQASASGDVAALASVLAEDAVLYSDGGGKRKAALNPIYGRDRIVRFIAGLRHKASYDPPQAMVPHWINQLPGCLLTSQDGTITALACEIAEGAITRVYMIRNPDKLRHLPAAPYSGFR